jgi:phage terminase large subunit-like protein
MDELPHWRRAQQAFDNLAFGLRLGRDPRGIITTTPLPTSVMRRLMRNPRTVMTRGTTYSNKSNLAPQFLEEIAAQYEGTRLGRQEIHGELLDDVPGAIWSKAMFDRPGFRARPKDLADYWQIVVSIDPSSSDAEASDECGVEVVASWHDAAERRFFDVLDDRSGRGSVSERYGRAIDAFLDWEADRFVVEVNAGGDHIAAILRSEWQQRGLPGLPPVEEVRAQRGHNKRVRAEPIAALYEQSRVRHCDPDIDVIGLLPDGTPAGRRYDALEDEMTTWSPLLAEIDRRRRSPGRMDALVWALTYLSSARRTILT